MKGAGGGPLAGRLAAARAAGRKLLVPYLTTGFPDLATTAAALDGLADAGVDAIELGVPFSDPLADGPTIAEASRRAIAGGASLAGAIALGADHAGPERPPLVLFTYLNPVLAYGLERAAADLAAAGFGGALVADLPFDEDPEVGAALAAAGLPLVRLAAPTTGPERLRALAAAAEGFVYLVARTGVTGGGPGADRRLAGRVAVLREVTDLPIVVGFGIDDVASARRAAAVADGVVVGSAFLRRLGVDGPAAAVAWMAELRRALDGA